MRIVRNKAPTPCVYGPRSARRPAPVASSSKKAMQRSRGPPRRFFVRPRALADGSDSTDSAKGSGSIASEPAADPVACAVHAAPRAGHTSPAWESPRTHTLRCRHWNLSPRLGSGSGSSDGCACVCVCGGDPGCAQVAGIPRPTTAPTRTRPRRAGAAACGAARRGPQL